MKITIRRLFLKIFLWFWATVILTGIAVILTFIFFQGRSTPTRLHNMMAESGRYSGTIAIERYEHGGTPAVTNYLQRIKRDTGLHACLFDANGVVLAGEHCDFFTDLLHNIHTSDGIHVRLHNGRVNIAARLFSSSGHVYLFATELPYGPREAFDVQPSTKAVRIIVVLLVSGGICYLLTLYLTAPILRLREAAQKLAGGDLSSRATTGMERRNDELGALVSDFNSMAEHIEELVSKQRQLLYDISHELRSPLARLAVALDLGRQRKGDDPAFDHMEQDLDRLGEMIGRLLTVARLDAFSAPVEMNPVSLGKLISQVAQNAEFEATSGNCTIVLHGVTEEDEYVVNGNEELLYSAVENVVRNAIRYTAAESSVEIHLEPTQIEDTPFARLTIRDHGAGVPESELTNIFRPFYRVADARDRQSGGTGLGLAIADRVVRLHQGTILARNASPQGLLIEIKLPLASFPSVV